MPFSSQLNATKNAPSSGRLVAEFGFEALCGGTGVVDVAGGRGDLAFELHCRYAAGMPVLSAVCYLLSAVCCLLRLLCCLLLSAAVCCLVVVVVVVVAVAVAAVCCCWWLLWSLLLCLFARHRD